VLARAVTLPKSIGQLRLSSRDPRAAPHIRYNFFDDRNDLDRLVEAVRLSRKIGRTAPFSNLIDHEMAPGSSVDDGEALRANITGEHRLQRCRLSDSCRRRVDPAGHSVGSDQRYDDHGLPNASRQNCLHEQLAPRAAAPISFRP
jgi:choline dehydrogenase-like flavoprotein